MKYIIIITSLFLLLSCNTNRFKVDTSQINLEVPIIRFDQDLLHFNYDDSLTSIASLQKKHGNFFKFYNHQVLNIGSSDKPEYTSLLKQFLNHNIYSQVYAESNTIFSDLSNQERELSEAFKRYKYFFPKKQVPAIYSYVSGFNTAISVADSLIGISLDDYLGTNHQFYNELNIYQYKRTNMHPDKIPSDCMLGWVFTEFPNRNKKGDLLSEIIYRGAILYIIEILMPDQPKYQLIGYSAKQYQWAKDHEEAMWTYIINNKHLFTTDQRILKKYIGEAPFTYYFDKESSPQAGIFLGWQIIRSYMTKNKDAKLQDILKIQNAQVILQQSGYQP